MSEWYVKIAKSLYRIGGQVADVYGFTDQDSWRQAPLPPHQEEGHCAQVRRKLDMSKCCIAITHLVAGLRQQASRYSCSSTSRVRNRLPPEEDRAARLRWLAMRQLRPGPNRSCFLDRGAEGREEGTQGVATEEALDSVGS